MKRRQHSEQRRLSRKRRERLQQLMRPAADRAGSTIVVVIVLMMGLLFLGMLLLTDAAQEKENAEYYAQAAKDETFDLDPEPIFQTALRQMMLGANDREFQSPFYGGRNSLLPTMFGRDMAPFSGEGLNLILWNEDNNGNGFLDPGEDINGNGTLDVATVALDQNYNGQPDSLEGLTSHPTGINLCPAANGSDLAAGTFNLMPEPDGGFVYPDHTSTFLSYRARIRSGAGTVIAELPSFHRPALLRSIVSNPANWYTDPATRTYTMRPHQEHYALYRNGTRAMLGGNPIYRFISAAHPQGAFSPFPFTGLQEGVYVSAGTSLNLDTDPDGDGVNNAVVLDLGFPIYTSPDGSAQFVPMVSATIRDLDALINLNVHGNMTHLRNTDGSTATLPPLTNFISKSNQGTSRSEVNPQWLLMANIGSAGPGDFNQHNWNFGRNPATNIDLANMEWMWVLTGRGVYQSPGGAANLVEIVPGVNGEDLLLKQMLLGSPPPGTALPGPGTTYTDDNGNQTAGGAHPGDGIVFPNTVQFEAFGHPLDYLGRGSMLISGNATQRRLQTVGRSRFPVYDKYQGNQPAYPATPLATQLRTNWQNSLIRDERGETRQWASLASAQSNDAILSAGDTAALHMSATDRAVTGRISDRVLNLLSYNAVNSSSAPETSRRLTTHSWDVKSFPRPYYSVSAPQFRNWEFSASANGSGGQFQFPPIFTSGNDAFRAPIRRLLRLWAGDYATKRLQRRLSINGLTEYDPSGRVRIRPLTPHVFGNDSAGIPKLDGTPVSGSDPNSLLGGVVSARISAINRPEQIGTGSDRYQRQEWLARYDRQRLCRDIYVMLYLFGGGNNVDYRGPNGSNQLYTDAQMREMAQLAVNWVDALDADNTITKFEYDKDLSNGWNLDDDPFTAESGFASPPSDINYPEDNGTRGVVYGVEAQQLTISEGLAILAKKITDTNGDTNDDDHKSTQFDDRQHRRFAYVELQNVSTGTILLSDGKWQLVIKNGDTGTNVAERRLTFRGSGLSVSAPVAGDDTTSRYLIATTGDTHNKEATSGSRTGAILPSNFEVNPENTNVGGLDTATYTRIAPKGSTDLDLLTVSNPDVNYSVTRAGTSLFGDGVEVTNTAASPAGIDWLNLGNDAAQTGINQGSQTILIQLRRRVHLSRAEPHRHRTAVDVTQHNREAADNPWVVVDEFRMPLSVFALPNENATATDVQAELQKLRSAERRQPLSLHAAFYPNSGVMPSSPASYRLNSLGESNDASGAYPAVFPLWQPHFDRDFASAAELFALPLYGPHDVTWRIGQDAGIPKPTAPVNSVTALPALKQKADYQSTAGNRFLRPDLPTGGVNPGNRWYRILELFEVPDPNADGSNWQSLAVGTDNQLGYNRTPGKISLNTLRHPGVLAGILDDVNDTTPGITFNPNGPTFLNGHGRDFWHEFLRARDGVDAGVTGLTLPGIPGVSKPFRDMSYALRGANSLEHTALRDLPQDRAAQPIGQRRALFEAGSLTQHTNRSTDTTIDFTTRYRLLSKVLNHTTTRSNTFVVFLQIDLYEATEVTADNGEKVVRIGQKLPSSPSYRQVYVIDRSLAREIVTQADLPKVSGGRFTFSLDENFDFSPLILHKQRIR